MCFLRSLQRLKRPELLTSIFDLRGAPRLSDGPWETLHFYSVQEVLWQMMNPYCVTGPAGGIKSVEALQGLVRGEEPGLWVAH